MARPAGAGRGPMSVALLAGSEATGADGAFLLEGLTAGESYELHR